MSIEDTSDVSDGSLATPSDSSEDDSSSDSDREDPDHAIDARLDHLRRNRIAAAKATTHINVVTANVQHKAWTRTERADFVVIAQTRNYHVVCIQEASMPNVSEDHGTHIYRSGPLIGKGSCNAFIISKLLAGKIMIQRKLSSPRQQILEIRLGGSKLSIVNVHRPHSGYAAAIRAEFDLDLVALTRSFKHPFMVLGDLNAKAPASAMRGAGHRAPRIRSLAGI